MAKYAKFQRKGPEKKGLNPIWRGIGCILIVVVPLISYLLMVLFGPMIIATGKVPYQLLGHMVFPPWAYRNLIVADIANFFSRINDLGFNLILFFLIVLVLTTVSSLFYAAFYSVAGPARYTELDAPPSKYKTKVYKR